MSIQSVNPVNGSLIQQYEPLSDQELSEKISSAESAWHSWKRSSYESRTLLLMNIAKELRSRKQELARLISLEMGKALNEAYAEIEKSASVCEYYGVKGAGYLMDEQLFSNNGERWVYYRPLGVILAVMPWNFPFWQVFRFLAPAIMAGNCGLLKHASNVPGCALEIEKIVLQAGGPEGLFQTLLVKSSAVSNILTHPVVQGVAFTGSTQAGQKVAEAAGRYIKKSVLELGGSDPYIILADANIENAAGVCVNSRLVNNGQSCVAAKRFIVVQDVASEFIEAVYEEMKTKGFGDPMDSQNQLGPMARADLRDELHQQVLQNIKMGAQCILGGQIPQLPGHHAFYPPTILTGIQKGMPAYDEEIFGPVASIIVAKDLHEAVYMANDTSFGLGAAVFTEDLTLGENIAKNELEAGLCFVNSMVKSETELPFGGIKQSGFGRELGAFGIREFVNVKSVVVKS